MGLEICPRRENDAWEDRMHRTGLDAYSRFDGMYVRAGAKDIHTD